MLESIIPLPLALALARKHNHVEAFTNVSANKMDIAYVVLCIVLFVVAQSLFYYRNTRFLFLPFLAALFFPFNYIIYAIAVPASG